MKQPTKSKASPAKTSAKSSPASQPQNTLDARQNKFTLICSMIAVALVGLVFVLLSVESILGTCRIDPVNPAAELINFDNDLVIVNLCVLTLSAILFIALMRRDIHLSRIDTRFIVFVMLIVSTIVPLAWINMVQSVASGEAQQMLSTARDAAQNSYTTITYAYDYYGGHSYYHFYPYQLGYVFFAELLYRIFGAGSSDLLLQIPNVIALDFAYVGLVMIAKRVFNRPAVTNLTAIALMGCLQPMFMTTYTYSLILGLAFSVWSFYFTLRYMQENKLYDAGLAALMITLATVLRYTSVVMLAAILVALVLHAIDKKRLLALAAAAVMIVCCWGAPKLVTALYSSRSGVALDTQITPTLDAYAGISDSAMAPGWYNGVNLTTLRDSGMDMSAADERAREGIADRMKTLGDSGELVNFYMKKLLSQTNEPSFQSVWISQVRTHDLVEGEQLNDLVTSMYTGGLAKITDNWFNYYNMMIYIGFAAAAVFLVIRRKTNPGTVILPLAALGGILYHLVYEGKSQFLLPYFVLLIPYAMYGLLELTRLLKDKLGWLFSEKKIEVDA
jgi:hypothetical protein